MRPIPTMNKRVRVMIGVCAACAVGLLAGSPLLAQEHAGQYAQADIVASARLYNSNCVTCHGAGGEGVDGVNLRAGQFRRASSDRDLTRIFRQGIPETAMPPGQYSQSELVGLVAFVRTMGDIDPGTIELGSATGGRAVFEGKGDCLSCHRVQGRGARLGPTLTEIGLVRSAGSIERSLMDPTGAMLPVNRPVRAVTRDGREFHGQRLNDDTFTVQMIDQNERLVSLNKADLREYEVMLTSPMPSYADTLTEAEMSDLMAYLVSLKGVN